MAKRRHLSIREIEELRARLVDTLPLDDDYVPLHLRRVAMLQQIVDALLRQIAPMAAKAATRADKADPRQEAAEQVWRQHPDWSHLRVAREIVIPGKRGWSAETLRRWIKKPS